MARSIVSSTAGQVYCWGLGRDGELGTQPDKENTVPFPTAVPHMSKVIQVCCGENFTVALKEDGTVWSWGRAGAKLGRADGANDKPGKVPLPAAAKQIACQGGEHVLAIVGDDAVVYSWGKAHGDPLGHTGEAPSPVLMRPKGPALQGAVFVQAGACDSAAIVGDGSLYVWGDNGRLGKLGLGSKVHRVQHPVKLDINGGMPVSFVALGSLFSAAILADGSLWTTGYNNVGNLGHGDRTLRTEFTRVAALTGKQIIDVSCTVGQAVIDMQGDCQGKEQPHMLLTDSEGRVYSCGSCHKGMIGNHCKKILSPKGADELVPYLIGSPCRDGDGNPSMYLQGVKGVQTLCASIHTAVVVDSGDCYCFGCGSGGRMGVDKYMNGLTGSRSRMKCYVSQPTAIETFARQGLHVHQAATSRHHMAAVVTNGAAAKARPPVIPRQNSDLPVLTPGATPQDSGDDNDVPATANDDADEAQ